MTRRTRLALALAAAALAAPAAQAQAAQPTLALEATSYGAVREHAPTDEALDYQAAAAAAAPARPASGSYCPPGNAKLPRSQRLDCSHPEPPCLEDEPCWRWPLMGNGMRGLVSLHGTPLTVGPCRYRRMYARAKRLHMAYLLGPALPGDSWARRHGCERQG
jgi:hypothetical protein